MNKKQKLFLLLGLFFTIGLLVYFFLFQRSTLLEKKEHSYQSWGIHVDFPENQALHYLFSLKGEQHSKNDTLGDLAGIVEFSGSFQLRLIEKKEQSFIVAFSFEKLNEKKLYILGQNILSDEAKVKNELFNRELYFEVGKDGKIQHLFIPKVGRKLLELIAPYLLNHFQLTPCSNDKGRICSSWENLERANYGMANTAYSANSDLGVFERKVLQYFSLDLFPGQKMGSSYKQKIEGQERFRIALEGYFLEIDSSSDVSIQNKESQPFFEARESFQLKFLKQSDIGQEEKSKFKESDFDKTENLVALQSHAAEKKLLELRVNGLSETQLFGGLNTFAIIGSAAQTPNWFYRASGLLLLKPELCQKLKKIFKTAEKYPQKRIVIVELLAAAGSIEAEKILLEIFKENQLSNEVWSETYQRVSFIENPSQAMIKMVLEKNQEILQSNVDKEERIKASLYTLASLLGKYSENGHEEEAKQYSEEILKFSPKNPSEEKILLNALGNTGLENLSDEIISFTNSADPEVRATAAFALRKMKDSNSLKTLSSLAVDDKEIVQLEAIRALNQHDSSEIENSVSRICHNMSSRRLSATLVGEIITLIESHPENKEGRGCLEYIIKNGDLPSQMLVRAKSALSRL